MAPGRAEKASRRLPSLRQGALREQKSHDRQRPSMSDHRACRRRGDAHALGQAQGPPRARGPLDAGPCASAVLEGARAISPSLSVRRRRRRRRGPESRAGSENLRPAERRGTAHAVLAARDQIERGYDDVLVVYADIPLIEASTLSAMRAELASGADVTRWASRPPIRLAMAASSSAMAPGRDPRAEGRDRRGARLAAAATPARSPSAAPRR